MPALCYNAATKFQCINGLSYTRNNKFILNALLECFTCIYTHCILSYLKCFIYLNFLLTACLLFCYRNWTCCSIYQDSGSESRGQVK